MNKNQSDKITGLITKLTGEAGPELAKAMGQKTQWQFKCDEAGRDLDKAGKELVRECRRFLARRLGHWIEVGIKGPGYIWSHDYKPPKSDPMITIRVHAKSTWLERHVWLRRPEALEEIAAKFKAAIEALG